jgi:hypothetical protein
MTDKTQIEHNESAYPPTAALKRTSPHSCQNRTFWDLLHVAADGVRLRHTIGVAEPFGIVPTHALDPTNVCLHASYRGASRSRWLGKAATRWPGRLRDRTYLAHVRSERFTKVLGVGRERAAFVPESG